MNDDTWALIDATHSDAWTPADRQLSAKVARQTYAAMLQDLTAAVRGFAPPDRQLFAVLEQSRPWWQDHVGLSSEAHRLELAFDRGTAPAFLLGLLTVVHRSPTGSVLFVSGRHGWPRSLRAARVEPEFGSDTLWVFGSAGQDWQDGAIAVRGRMQVLLEAYRLVQPDLLRSFLAALGRDGGGRQQVIEELYPFLPELDLFRDVLAPAVSLAPHIASTVQHLDLSAA